MGLFEKKSSEEEKMQQTEDKKQSKEEEKERKEEFKKITKKATTYTMSINKDSDGKAQPNGLLFLFLKPDSTAYLSYTATGNVFKTEYNLEEYSVIDFEWMENVETKGKKIIGRSIAGGLLAGPAGMIIGGVTGKDKKKDKSTAILTLQNRESKEVRMFSFDCDSKKMRNYKMIKTLPLLEKTEEKSPIEQIKEYKELLDLEIITQDEFNQKKSELLG